MIDHSFSEDTQRAVISYTEERLTQFAKGKTAWDRLMYTSILFYRGKQWISFDLGTLRFRMTNLRRAIPRPVTNKYKPTINSIISSILRFDPKIVIAPQTDTLEDMQTAWAGNRIVKTIENEVNWQKRKMEMAPWLTLTGNAFAISGFDDTGGAKKTMRKVACPACEKFEGTIEPNQPLPDCPDCYQSFGVKSPLQPQIDGRTKQPKEVEEPTGAQFSEVVNPFEIFLDNRIVELQNHQTIIRIHQKDVEWARAKWPALKEKIQPHKRPELNARMLNALANLAFPGDQEKSETSVDLVEIWEKPSPKFPKGFYCVRSNEALLHDLVPFKWRTNRGQYFFPITHFLFDKEPGSLLGSTPGFDLIEKQKTRNRVEALGEMILMRMSNPVWLMPTPGTQDDPTGLPGQKLKYDPRQTDGAKPERVEGAMMPNAIVAWLDRTDRDFAEISGQYETARGERPLSVKSGYAVEKLRELQADRNTGLFTNFSIATAEWQQQNVEIFRQAAPPDRYARILGENAGWTVSKLQESDLKGGVDIFAEPAGSLPKTHLERLATLELFIQQGVVDLQDPMQKIKLAREYGMPNIFPSLDADQKYIARETDRFKRGTADPERAPFDNDVVHLAEHVNYAKCEEFEQLKEEDPERAMVWLNHITEHLQAIQLAQQQAAQAQAEAEGAAPPPQPTPMRRAA